MLAARASANGRGSGAGYQDDVTAYMADVGAIPLLSAEDERVLGERAARGDADAVDRLVRANLRLVIHLARGYAGSGVPLGDLIQEGNQGLMRAAQKYDVARGVRFSTYAGWWIRQAIMRGVSRNKSGFRLPEYLHQRIYSLRRAETRLRESEGREPSANELAAPLALSVDQVRRAQQSVQRHASLEHLMRTKVLARSLEKSVAQEGGRDPFDAAVRGALCDAVRECLAVLPARFRDVLRMRFGLDGRRPRTLDFIGRRMGISRERVRQIEVRALEMLRRSSAARKLSSFAEM